MNNIETVAMPDAPARRGTCPCWSGLGVMPANNTSMQIGYLAGKYPGRLGLLISPGGWRKPPSWMPYALDNGAFSAWVNRKEWDEGAFMDLLELSRRHFHPLWVVVPDVVSDRAATLRSWEKWAPRILEVEPHVQLAFAVQDGMEPSDVPEDAAVVFVGGTTEWKWRNLRLWTENFPRVHVGRVNSERKLWQCHDAGAESCDGTGWMRGGESRIEELERFLRLTTRSQEQGQMIMEAIL